MQQLISISQYARLRGLNKSTISRQVREGKIPLTDGKIDPLAADRARDANLYQGRRERARRAKQPDVQQPTAEDVLLRIGIWRDRLPELTYAFTGRLDAALLSAEIIDGLLLFGLGDAVEDVFGPGAGPGVEELDYPALAERLKVHEAELTKAYESIPEAWGEAISRFFSGEPSFAEALRRAEPPRKQQRRTAQ